MTQSSTYKHLRAKHVFRLIVSRSGLLPGWLADPTRVDHIEVVDIGSNEVVLFWDCPVRETNRVSRILREDLTNLDAVDFIAKWDALQEKILSAADEVDV